MFLIKHAILILGMADREIDMNLRECTSRSPLGKNDRFPSKPYSESSLTLIQASRHLLKPEVMK